MECKMCVECKKIRGEGAENFTVHFPKSDKFKIICKDEISENCGYVGAVDEII